MRKFYSSLFFRSRFYGIFVAIIMLFVTAYFIDIILPFANIALLSFLAMLLVDLALLYLSKGNIAATRGVPQKLSNGDDNKITISIINYFGFNVNAQVIDEIPVQFQERNFFISSTLKPGEERRFDYSLRPVTRGEYEFGKIHCFVQTFIGLLSRRISQNAGCIVPVYPSFLQMRKYELLAVSNRLEEVGIKKIRRIGLQNEFDQVREYAVGDDYRTMNWKATARKGSLMVNQYQDEKAQDVYCLIDMGRVMKMPFEGMTLLDYAINASLVISNIALNKHDKAGVIPFSNQVNNYLAADKRNIQMNKILELLYNLNTDFLEPNYELLYITLRRLVKQRALLLLFTNFESMPSMQRHLPMLKKLARNHLLLTVFFQNTELNKLLTPQNHHLDQVYNSIVAESFIYDKKLIVKELNNNGIHSLLTEPQNLNVNIINRYLEFKSLGMI